MQTFMTAIDLKDGTSAEKLVKDTAMVLDFKRLGKQRVETMQIWNVLSGQTTAWKNHPAVIMWRGHTDALAMYGYIMSHQFREYGYDDNMLPEFFARLNGGGDWPWWLGNPAMVATHRSKLVGKLRTHYRFKWEYDAATHHDLPYIWPNNETQTFFLSKAEFDRKDWTVPGNWDINFKTREVTINA